MKRGVNEDAYQQGVDAYNAGQPETAYPYRYAKTAQGQSDMEDWRDGWNNAEMEDD